MLDPKGFALVIDLVGVTAGIISLFVILTTSSKIGGQVGSAFNLVLYGIIFQMSAVIYTIIFVRLKLFPAPAFDFHHGLMVAGLIFFVVAAKKFSDLSR